HALASGGIDAGPPASYERDGKPERRHGAMSLQQITDGLRERVGTDSGLGASVKFDFGPDGVVVLDATKVPNEVGNDDRPTDCTMKIAMDDFLAMTRGELDGTTAFMMGKLKIEGDMSVALRLQGLLRG